MPTKKPWESKTVILGLITAVAPFIPGVDEFIKNNPIAFTTMMGLLFTGLRLVTSGKVSIE